MIHYISTNGIGNAWIAAEIRILMEQGVPIRLHSMRKPHLRFYSSQWAKQIDADTSLLYPLPIVSMAWSLLVAPLLFRGRLLGAMVNALFGTRENLRGRVAGIAHLLVACHWARMLRREEVTLIHSQWIHSCGTIGMYGAWLLGKPFSFTGHACDLFRDRVALDDKVRRADFIVCISNFHRELYLRHGADAKKLVIVYCGIDVKQFDFQPVPRADRTDDVPHIISIGRLVEKKGFEYLIDACKILRDRGVAFRCTIAGDGPLEPELRLRIKSLKLEDRVDLTGKAVLQEHLADFMHGGDIFAQPCVWSSDNDVDGTPRTLMEAMACGTPVVSTHLAGIPDIVEHDVSGLLVEPNSVDQLAEALLRIIESPALAERLSRSGRAHIERSFKLPDCLAPLEAMFRQKLKRGSPGAPIHDQETHAPAREMART